MKIGICGNCDVNQLADALDEYFRQDEIIVGENHSWKNELLNPPEDFCKLDFCVIAIDWQKITPLIYEYTWNDNFSAALNQFTEKCMHIKNLLFSFRRRCQTKILLFTPSSPQSFPTGFITRLLDNSPMDLFNCVQNNFNSICRSVTDCYPVDINSIRILSGIESYSFFLSDSNFDSSDLFLVKSIAKHCKNIIDQFCKYPLKCIVLDLDNTLWGGIIGENSIDSIILSKEGAGRGYYNFQHDLVKYYKQGILLAICSKNNTCDALDVIETHPDMLIRPSMISSFRINWDDKPENIISIAKELCISPDSMLFVDDSSSERALMKAALPEIEVLDLPENPANFSQTLRNCSRLWPIQLTTDDLNKRTYFSMDKLRKRSIAMEQNISEFLRKSGLKLVIRQADAVSLPRITQLFNKTNQFNLTTKRYSETELEVLHACSENSLLYMKMSDSFGDYGIIGSALIINSTIDSFLISCRALGKDVENAFLWHILNYMKKNGLKNATGCYIPTLKNIQTENFYKTAGFKLKEKNSDATYWTYDLTKEIFSPPDWFEFV